MAALTTDGGGMVRAARRPIRGAGKVARALAGIAGRPYQGLTLGEMTIEQAEINGEPGAFVVDGDRVVAAGTFTVVGGRIAAIQLVTNPEKLDAISARRTLRL